MNEHLKHNDREQPPLWERIAIFAFGVSFVAVLLVLAFVFPYPTPYEYTICRIVLALSAAAVATLLTGFIFVEIPRFAKAGGALAVFLIVFFYSPAALVVNDLGTIQQNMSGKLYGTAQTRLEAIVKLYPNNAEALNLLGHVYWKQLRPTDALEKFEDAAKLAGGHDRDRYLYNAAAAELVLGKYREASDTLEDVVSRDPKDPATQYNLGIAKAQLKQYDKAQAIFVSLYNAGETIGMDYRPVAKLQLGLLAILQHGESGLDEAIHHFKDAIFFERPLDAFFLGCSSVVNDEDFSVEGRVLETVAKSPAYLSFKHELSNGHDCPSRIAS